MNSYGKAAQDRATRWRNLFVKMRGGSVREREGKDRGPHAGKNTESTSIRAILISQDSQRKTICQGVFK